MNEQIHKLTYINTRNENVTVYQGNRLIFLNQKTSIFAPVQDNKWVPYTN